MAGLIHDKRGATAVMFAVSAVAMLAMAGLVIDVGNLFTAKRQLQGTTDLAAIAAATELSQAAATADANAKQNGYAAADVADVELGTYTPDPGIAAAARFQPGTTGTPNAVRVTMTHAQPLFFGPVFAMAGGGKGPAQTAEAITAQGIAVSQNVADFSIGTTVASFNGGVVNAVLGALVGGNVSLSAIDYNNLASAKVDLFGLANAVALQTGQVGGTYQQVFSGTVQLSALLTALANEQPGASSVLQQLAAQAALSGATVDLSRLIEYGPFSKLSLSEPEPNVSATASVLSILQAALQVGGASHLINLNIGASIPGLSTVTAEMSIGEPAQGTTVMAVDQVGTTVHTAQVRFYFNIGLVGVPPASLVNLPLYVEVGYGTATLAALSCNSPLDATTTTATLNVTPGLLYGIIGTVTPAQMTNFSAEPPGEALNANGTVSAAVPAPLVSLLGLPVLDGAAAAAVGNQTPTPVGFTYADIQNGTVKTTSTTDFVGSLITSVTQNLKLTAVGVPVPGLPGAVTATLTAAAGPLDTLLTDALQTAGVGVGSAATWVNGARCGAALLAG